MSIDLGIIDTPLAGLKIVEVNRIVDSRGFLERLFCSTELSGLLGGRNIAQINHTLTERSGTVRGMHFQHSPYGEMKFVVCLRGEVFDVGVDLRRDSPTFLKWHAEQLGEANPRIMLIPEGFAHGFQTLTNDCEMLYFHTSSYHPEAEGGVSARDPMLSIRWPKEITELSSRDASHPMLSHDYSGLVL